MRFVGCLLLFTFSFAIYGEGTRSLYEIANGPPAVMTKGPLDLAAYRTSEARRLANPQLLWFNFNWARENDVKVNPRGLTLDFRNEVYNAFAWQIPAANDPATAFTHEWKTVYAEGYGADDTYNLGSGRAASNGNVQVKGIGPTEMVRDHDEWHSNGAFLLTDGFKESIMSEVAANELASGANRVIALIATGTYVEMDGQKIPRVLVVREDSVRPAHFIHNDKAGSEADRQFDTDRVKAVIANLPYALPQSRKDLPNEPGPRLKAGLNEFADRLGKRYADAWSRRLHHGGESISNVLLDGGMIDFGTFTALDGWTRYLTDHQGKPFGDISDPSRWIIQEWMNKLADDVPAEWKRFLPKPGELERRFEAAYERALPQAMLQTLGVPKPILEKLKIEGNTSGAALGQALLKMAKAGNQRVHAHGVGDFPSDWGTYNLAELIPKLIQNGELTYQDLPDSDLRQKLNGSFRRFLRDVVAEAERDGVSKENLLTLMDIQSRTFLKRTPHLYYSGKTWQSHLKAWDEFLESNHDSSKSQRFFDEHIREGSKTFKSAPPYEALLHLAEEAPMGFEGRTVFDAVRGKYFKQLRFSPAGESIYMFLDRIPLEMLEGTRLSYSVDGRFGSAPIVKEGKQYEIEIPIADARDRVTIHEAIDSTGDVLVAPHFSLTVGCPHFDSCAGGFECLSGQ